MNSHLISSPSGQPSPRIEFDEKRVRNPAVVRGKRLGDGLAAQYSSEPGRELSITGQEKVAATVNLCRMNLAVHGLEGDILSIRPTGQRCIGSNAV